MVIEGISRRRVRYMRGHLVRRDIRLGSIEFDGLGFDIDGLDIGNRLVRE